MFDTKLEKNRDIFIESHKVIRQIKNNLRDKSYLDARLLLSIVMKNEIYGHEKIKIYTFTFSRLFCFYELRER